MKVKICGIEYGELVKLERNDSRHPNSDVEHLYNLSVYDKKRGVTHLFDDMNLRDVKFLGASPFLDENIINAIGSVIAKGDRVELIPVKDGVKVVRVRREEVKK